MKKLWILILVTASILLHASDDNVSYKGSSFNINLVFEPSCLSLLGNTDVLNKHVGVVGRLSYCDVYEDDSQNYLVESYIVGTGIVLFSHSIYRDSFFLSAVGSVGYTYVKDVLLDINVQRLTALATVGGGYQWQFQKGYIFTIGMYAAYSKPFAYETSSNKNLNEVVSSEKIKYTPTFLVGWRF